MPLPYIPNTDADRSAMLRDIGVGSTDELFQDIPQKYRDVLFKLPPASWGRATTGTSSPA